jgi:hypothetical protein
MNERLTTAALAVAFVVLALPATNARPAGGHAARPAQAGSDEWRESDDDNQGRRHRSARKTYTKVAARTDSASDDDSDEPRRTRRHRRSSGSGGAGTSRTCLTAPTRALLGRIEAQFGRVQIISTCRPGAVIAGTGRRSKHASGQAVDFNAPAGKKGAVVQWLIANHKSGGTMTYRGMSHIHVDIGQHFVSLNSGGGR